ncbi:hypothetical protein DKP76_03185 [Falsochrobactrum shanghaiense]|uniref:Uncharacterized protein n=1 Tax=Falsochrobactrum shanghaiense TaxID=2201899 RepID=A0A316JG03_9HYPH|nr:hypothetical protein DKP76_03185 [Falsochrobactrum shanghaiense]
MKVGKRSGHSFLACLLMNVRKADASSTSHGRPWKTWQVIHSEQTCVQLSILFVDKTRNIAKPRLYPRIFHKET